MKNSSIIKIIDSFTEDEVSEFLDFLKSPFHNKKSGVVKLYMAIKKHYPDFKKDELEKETLWNSLYPGKEFNSGVMKNLIFDITKLAEEFIMYKNLKLNELRQFTFTYEALADRKIKSILDNKVTIIERKFNDESFKNIDISIREYLNHFHYIYDIKLWQDYFFNEQSYKLKSSINDQNHLDDSLVCSILIQCFIVYYNSFGFFRRLSDKSKIGNNSKELLDILVNSNFEKIINNIRKNSETKYILLKSYYLAYIAHSNINNIKHYYELKQFLHDNVKSLPDSVARDIEEIVDNVSANCEDPKLDKMKEFLDTMKFRYRNNMVLEINNRLNSMGFWTWLYYFFHENKVTEMKAFVDQYYKFVIDKDEDKENILMFADAVMRMMTSDYKTSLEIISKINFKYPSLKNTLKKFMLILSYELNDVEMFEFNYDSHLHFASYNYLEKKSMTDLQYNKTKKFLSSIKELFKLKLSSDHKDIVIFEKKILSEQTEYKTWFLRKLNELKLSKSNKSKPVAHRTAN